MNNILTLVIVFLYGAYASAENVTLENIEFYSHNERLSGSLVFPKNKKFNAAVVFVHGSGPQERSLYWAKYFAADGIVALVYDKRGVGKSGGEYESKQSVSEKNINLLADDAIAALNVLKNHNKTKKLLHGLAGISQAGWIVPIAAEKVSDLDFVVLWSGPVCKVSEEDIFSKYTSDKDLKSVPSYQEALAARTQKYIWPDFLGKDSNPSDSLAKLDIPGLWIFGKNDGSIPVDLSIDRLSMHIEKGKKYEYVLFSSQGHNNMSATFTTATNWIHRLQK